MTQEDQYVCEILAHSMAISKLSTLSELDSAATNTEIFELTEAEDLSALTQEFSDQLTRQARKFFSGKSLKIRLARSLLPLSIKMNSI